VPDDGLVVVGEGAESRVGVSDEASGEEDESPDRLVALRERVGSRSSVVGSQAGAILPYRLWTTDYRLRANETSEASLERSTPQSSTAAPASKGQGLARRACDFLPFFREPRG